MNSLISCATILLRSNLWWSCDKIFKKVNFQSGLDTNILSFWVFTNSKNWSGLGPEWVYFKYKSRFQLRHLLHDQQSYRLSKIWTYSLSRIYKFLTSVQSSRQHFMQIRTIYLHIFANLNHNNHNNHKNRNSYGRI